MGIITAGSFFLHRDQLKTANDLASILSKPLFLPETTPARLLLRRFEEKSEKVALVVDERRAIVGLVSQEDVVEEVVGEIADRRDQMPLYEQPNPHTLIASAKMELWELEELWGITLESAHDMKTLGGWLTEQIGDIPRPGTKYETNNLLFQVLSSEPKRVQRIYILKKRRKQS